jgi:aerobic-type carbon monoxide dehydrogenase small subunit (CoxS/CutS family)
MKELRFYFNGRAVTAVEGQTVAMALWAAGIRVLRTSARCSEPRGLFCGMGVCQECVVWIDGQLRESCMALVRPELSVSGTRHDKE